MNFWQWMAGDALVRVTCANREAALEMILRAGITVRDAADTDALTVEFRVTARKLKQLETLAGKKGWKLEILERTGLLKFLRLSLARPVLMFGLAAVFAASGYLPTRVLFVRVEGNSAVPTKLILEKAAECGIGFGASRQHVRSQKMKDALLDALPQLQWAGVTTAGCTATITVREHIEEPVPEQKTVSSIVADRDGIITEITVTQGTARFAAGQAVKAGEVLISGYTDCGITIRAQQAKGEVYARTKRELEVVTLSKCGQERQNQPKQKKYALIIGKKRINFYKGSGISGGTCDKMYLEYYVTLPGGFPLPVCIVTETWWDGTIEEAETDPHAATELLHEFAHRYLTERMTAGTVTESQVDLAAGEGICTLTGNYACIEMIGRQRNEGNLIGKYD